MSPAVHNGSRRRFKFAALFTGLVAIVALAMLLLRGPIEIPAYPSERVLRSALLDGIQYKLADDGNVFRVIDERGTWTLVERVFDPADIARDFVREGDMDGEYTAPRKSSAGASHASHSRFQF